MTSVTVSTDNTATVNKSRVSKTEIKLATVDEVLAEASILFEEHYIEIARNKHLMVLKPDEETYRKSEEMGSIFILSARQDNVLIGYSVNFVTNHLHYADLKLAQNDLLFIKKYLGVEINNVNCTKIMSKIARSYSDKHGLKDLIKEFVGVDISKQYQTSDFGGDLSAAQIKYCANDVIYLHKIKLELESMLISCLLYTSDAADE